MSSTRSEPAVAVGRCKRCPLPSEPRHDRRARAVRGTAGARLPPFIPVVLLASWTILAGGCSSLRVDPPARPETAQEALAAPAGRTVAIPAEWTGAETRSASPIAKRAEGSEPWWRSFGDPTLSELIEQSLEGSFDLVAAAARVEAATARARVARAPLLPQADGSLTASRTRRNFIGFPIPGGEERVLTSLNTTWGLSLNLSWEVDLWGRLRSARDAVGQDLEAARADLAGAALSLSGQTAKAYFAVLEAREQTALARATLDNRRRNTERVRRRFEAGLVDALDLRLARSEEASAEGVLQAQLQALDALERQLQTLLVQYPDRGLDRLPEELPGVFEEGPEPVPAGLPAEIVSRRPDLAAAEARLAAAGFRVAEARAALYPGIQLTGSAGRSSEDVEDLLDGDFSVWSIAGSLLQPLFQGGRLRANVDLSRATFEESTALYAEAILQALRDVETALAAEGFLASRTDALERAATEARRAQELAEERYRMGLTDYLNVLEAQRRAFDADSRLLQAERQRLDARVDLVLALGGGYSGGHSS